MIAAVPNERRSYILERGKTSDIFSRPFKTSEGQRPHVKVYFDCNSLNHRMTNEIGKVLGKVQTDLCFEKPKFHLKI